MYEIRVGCGKRTINVPEELYPFPIYANYSFDEMGDSGDLHARALVIDNGQTYFLFVGTDVSDAPGKALREAIEEKYGIPEDHMYVTAAHNHSAPHGGGRKGAGKSLDPTRFEKEAAYRAIYEQGILDAVGDAMESRRPARYGFGEGKSYINVNRDLPLEDGYWTQGMNPAGPSDKTLAALKFTDFDGRLIGAVVNYACHGTTAFCVKDTNGRIRVTPGFAGIACSYAEERFRVGNARADVPEEESGAAPAGDAREENGTEGYHCADGQSAPDPVIVWTNGASGDQNPLFCSEGFPRTFDPDGYTESVPTPPGTQYMIQRSHGGTHGVDIIRTLNSITADSGQMPITCTETQVELEAQKAPEGADMFVNKLFCDNTVRQFRPDLCPDGKVPEKKLVRMEPDGTVSMTMRLALLGDVGWVGVYGEPYSTIGMKCKAASPLAHTVMVLHVDDEIGVGYILDDASADHTVFQSFSTVHPGHVDDAIVGGTVRLCEQALAVREKEVFRA